MIFLPKNIKVFQLLSKSKYFSFMTKVTINNGKETKLAHFAKSDIIFKRWQNTKIFK